MATEQIAKIEDTSLGYEGHGILTCYLHVTYGGSSQGVGGYALDRYDEKTQRRVGTAYGMEFVRRLMSACGVDTWEAVKGRTVIVLKEGNEWTGRVIGLRPLPTEPGSPFMFDELVSLAEAEEKEAVA